MHLKVLGNSIVFIDLISNFCEDGSPMLGEGSSETGKMSGAKFSLK